MACIACPWRSVGRVAHLLRWRGLPQQAAVWYVVDGELLSVWQLRLDCCIGG
jgi:hypothetical protein